jgi:hypothetical protein
LTFSADGASAYLATTVTTHDEVRNLDVQSVALTVVDVTSATTTTVFPGLDDISAEQILDGVSHTEDGRFAYWFTTSREDIPDTQRDTLWLNVTVVDTQSGKAFRSTVPGGYVARSLIVGNRTMYLVTQQDVDGSAYTAHYYLSEIAFDGAMSS